MSKLSDENSDDDEEVDQFKEGFGAAENGFSFLANPYHEGTDAYAEWSRGWYASHDAVQYQDWVTA
jgi:hypothetical protein